MNWDSLTISIAGVSWASALAAGTYCVLASNLFDIKQAAADKKAAKHPYSQCFKNRPLISVIILAENNQDTVIECLKSISQSGYRKYEVLIVDNDSKDVTKKVVKQFIKSSRRKKLKLLTIKSSNANQTLKVCLSASKGDLIIFTDANSVLDKNSLKGAVNYIQAKQARRWSVNLRPVNSQNMASFAQSINYSIFELPMRKLHSFKSSSTLERGVLYSKEEAKNSAFNPRDSASAPKKSVARSRSAIFSVFKASWLILFGYLSYVAVGHNYGLPLGLFLLSVLIYSAVMVSSDSSASFKAKAATILTLPGGLILIYASIVLRAIKRVYTLFVDTAFFNRAFLKKA